MKNRLPLILFILFLSPGLSAQHPQERKLNVFIDCSNTWCDYTYMRTEINMVNFLLDRMASDLHVLITAQQAGNGGKQYQLIFYGQHRYAYARDTLVVNTDPNATEFERREQLVHYLKLGMAPFIAKTNQAKTIKIIMKTDSQDSAKNSDTNSDKWNFWVFRVGANGHMDRDQVYRSGRISGNFSANRVTDKLKVSIRFYGGKNFSSYDYETDEGPRTIKVNNNDFGFNHALIKSINSHWSYGYEFSFSNNSFSNNKQRIVYQPALEYNFLPYKEVNTKLLTLSYGLQFRYNQYYDTTLFNRINETLFGHVIKLSASFNQKWGTLSNGISYRNYFRDWSLNNIGFSSNFDIRVTGGLSFYIYVYGGIIHDQIYLPRDGATEEEVLTRRRQLASSFNFSTYFGITYRFGSKLNNFVNPRFEGEANYIGSD